MRVSIIRRKDGYKLIRLWDKEKVLDVNPRTGTVYVYSYKVVGEKKTGLIYQRSIKPDGRRTNKKIVVQRV